MSAHTITVASMTLAHLEPVLAIERASSPQPWTAGVLTDELAHGDTRAYRVALLDGVVVGFAGVLVQVGEGHITNIAVDAQHRRSGIARRLLVSVVRTAVSRGAGAITLEVRTSNIAAQRLYHQFGFAPSGVRPRYYADGEDALIMWADDVDTEAYQLRLDQLETSSAGSDGVSR